MYIPFADLSSQYRSLQPEIDLAMKQVIEKCAFINGPYAHKFEEEFAQFCAADFCVGVGNGTDALFVALKGLGVGPGDEVLVPAMTFIATAEAVSMAGAKPVFVDVDPENGTMDVADLRAKISQASKAVIPVHLYGHPADMEAIEPLARENGLFIVQDAAQAHGATVGGRSLSAFGDCACYSFYPGKNLGAYGDAGAIVTGDAVLAERMRKFANHGRKDKYDHQFEGVNSRMDGLQAAVLSVKLKHLKDWTDRRRAVAAVYDRELSGIEGFKLLKRRVWAGHVYHLYVVRCNDREALSDYLAENGVASGIHYPVAVPFMEAYECYGHTHEDFPAAYAMQESILSLPMYAELSEDSALRVCEVVRGYFAGAE
ncbi:DegT/DnrJ/EryC1/StrS family aminotransferase [Maridesulfovibrio salexigens]|uniref:DegT/DnrJ/EryC1/StrS aminotransferase n=1 Tax=Maridesulfovibrio salexigens (strain ATCC 14822 / DSM 2638 / NCIMB 8403 / VKM B-1763) TaxID=526222 RepID=C6BXU9_MARSD|nr:DegT/DnrJ/EryC1/StrS family aminotransferase [Maridesulfovibrio salexigens]ACS78657.1 DegT/DnrJ/EryC1/StrS aminotransferase [Maridesulfovibrio salexigens DSM 2638]